MEAGRDEKGVDLGEVGGVGGEGEDGGDAVDDVAAVHDGDWVGGGGGFGGRAETGKEVKAGRSPAGRESRCHYGAGMAAVLSVLVFPPVHSSYLIKFALLVPRIRVAVGWAYISWTRNQTQIWWIGCC